MDSTLQEVVHDDFRGRVFSVYDTLFNVTFVVAVIINATVLARDRTTALTYRRWSHLLGYPSVLFVVLFAGVGISLYLSRARLAAAPTSFDLRES